MPLYSAHDGFAGELKSQYYNVSYVTDSNSNKYNLNDMFSFLIIIMLLCLFINTIRCCVFLSNKSKKKIFFYKINKFNVNEEGINTECPICLEEATTNIITIRCKHVFHKRCLHQWAETSIQDNSFKCPLCNVMYVID